MGADRPRIQTGARGRATSALARSGSRRGTCLSGNVLQSYDWDWKAAEAEFRRAFELAPGNVFVLRAVAGLVGTLGRHDEAIELLQKAAALDPLSTTTQRFLGLRCAMYGRLDDAVAALHVALDLNPKAGLAHCFLSITRLWQGRTAEALEEAELEPFPDFRLLAITLVQHTLGHALEWLERAFAQRDPGLAHSATDRFLAPLHGDPRWAPFIKKMGFA